MRTAETTAAKQATAFKKQVIFLNEIRADATIIMDNFYLFDAIRHLTEKKYLPKFKMSIFGKFSKLKLCKMHIIKFYRKPRLGVVQDSCTLLKRMMCLMHWKQQCFMMFGMLLLLLLLLIKDKKKPNNNYDEEEILSKIIYWKTELF